MKKQIGFTLIELLVVIAIIGILGKLGITSFTVYKSNAAYANIERAMHEVANAASAGTLDVDNLPSAVSLTTQNTPGGLTSAAAQNFLVGFKLSQSMKLSVSYDPSCSSNSCVSGFAQINHCSGKQYMQYLLYGDGSYETISNIDGAGCA
jgi:prepilin-type N-terminal cleavage/methylation domain-containing protein